MNETLQRQSVFKKTRRGKVIRLVKDKYVRTDVECGVLHNSILRAKEFLRLVDSSNHRQVLIIDTTVCVNEIDVLEYGDLSSSFAVVILQSVLFELRNLNLSCYQRICSLLADEKKSFIFYANEVSCDTTELRFSNEDMNVFTDRLIYKTVGYFYRILAGRGEALLLSNREKQTEPDVPLGFKIMKMRDYVQQFLKQYPELLDLLSAHDSDHLDMTLTESGTENDSDNSSSTFSFPPHASVSEVSDSLKVRKFYKGVIRCQKNDYTKCYVIVFMGAGEDSRRSIQIEGYKNVNRAVDGDLVAVELISESDRDVHDNSGVDSLLNLGACTETEKATIPDLTAEEDESVSIDCIIPSSATVTASTSSPSAAVKNSMSVGAVPDQNQELYGRVVGIVRRNWRQYAGSLVDLNEYVNSSARPLYTQPYATSLFNKLNSKSSAAGGAVTADGVDDQAEAMLFIAVDKKIPPVLVKTRFRSKLIGHRILVGIDYWQASSIFPWGHYIKVLGKGGDTAVETQVLLHEFDVSHESFTAEVMACLPNTDWKITENIVSQRLDLRHLPVVSIDPPGCKDIDDALHCRRLPNGNLEVGVHIADVTFFVHPDTALDKEAAHRSTSTYLVERRLDMLPGYLTTDLCSLRSHEDHLAFSVLWEMDFNGNILKVTFHKSVIHSVASLTYDEAQIILDDKSASYDVDFNPVEGTQQQQTPLLGKHQISESVKLLNHLAHILRNRRIEMGALTLASPEVRFKMDSETQNPTDVNMYNLKESNALVEEFMLLANITVGKQIFRSFPTLSVLRRHPAPSQLQFTALLKQAKIVGVELDITSSKSLADSLDAAEKKGDPYFNKLLRIMSTRCMKPAQYFCSGEIPKELWHHYGLAAPVYTHFTSPIRRYADVIVHRLLAASIGVIPLPPASADRTKQQELCTHMNRRHKAAQYVQRASVSLHTVLFFKNRTGSNEDAYVLSLSIDKIVAFVPRFALEGTISMADVCKTIDGKAEFDEDECILIIRSLSDSNKVLFKVQVFGKCVVTIKVLETISGHSSLDMDLIVTETNSNDDSDIVNSNEQQKSSRKQNRHATVVVDPASRKKIKK